jgi:hypothetical protein
LQTMRELGTKKTLLGTQMGRVVSFAVVTSDTAWDTCGSEFCGCYERYVFSRCACRILLAKKYGYTITALAKKYGYTITALKREEQVAYTQLFESVK